MIATSLFDPTPIDDPEAEPGHLAPNAAIPRDYQMEDIRAMQEAWKSVRTVLYRAATGLGKATVLGTIAVVHRPQERTLCLINTVKLAKQLRQTFARQLGWTPGLIGGGIFDGTDRRVVIAVVQSMYSETSSGVMRFERFDPTEFGTVLIDECESALADQYMKVIRHFLNGNPDLHLLGCTATPIRGDGVGMGVLFDKVVEEEGPLNRGPLWAFQQGWLVPPRQAFIRCSVDFSTLKIRKGTDGEKDYNEDQLAEVLSADENLIEMAQGIIRTAGDDRCMVVCPNSTDTCDRVSDYLNAAKAGSAAPVHGRMPDPEGVMAAHQRGEFQFLCGVNMLTTGYDDPKIKKVYILRPTKSQRLFQQIIGRAFRPHDSIARQLGELPDATARREMIANSEKPRAIIYCLVGVEPSARDMQIADLLRGRLSDEELDRVKQRMLDGVNEPAGDDGDSGTDVGEVVKEVRKTLRNEKEAAQRRRVEVQKAEMSITELDDGQDVGRSPKSKWTGAYETLRRMGFKDNELQKLNPEQAGKESRRWIARAHAKPAKLCSYGQWKILARRGWDSGRLEKMTSKEAGAAIDTIAKQERWNSAGAA